MEEPALLDLQKKRAGWHLFSKKPGVSDNKLECNPFIGLNAPKKSLGIATEKSLENGWKDFNTEEMSLLKLTPVFTHAAVEITWPIKPAIIFL